MKMFMFKNYFEPISKILHSPPPPAPNVFDLSNAADAMVRSVLQSVTAQMNPTRTISPFPGAGTCLSREATVSPLAKTKSIYIGSSDENLKIPNSENLDSSELEFSENENVEEGKKTPRMSTTISLDRIKEIIEAEKEKISETESETESESDGDIQDEIPINHRPRSASVGHLRLERSEEEKNIISQKQHPKTPMTDRPRADVGKSWDNSDNELITILGPSRNLNIWVGTWNLNLNTAVNAAHLQNFLNIQSAINKDVYIFGCQVG